MRRLVPLLVGVLALAGCSGPAESPLGATRWQVVRITDDPDRATLLPDTLQGRVYLVIGRDTFTGGTGCLTFSGRAWWADDESRARLSDMTVTPSPGRCIPGEEDTAERLRSVLGSGDLAVTRPAEHELKLTRTDEQVEPWQTPRSVEFTDGAG
ncbi:hypothetical protein [Corynebacterium bovis]|uniref:DUF306 domain-containing protein n=2 Tax=Corynebacterium bovis TaxID=36808 RepID=A0A8I0CKD9_9CORY|nr:hypothetical protein [Corynebacterium bovis]MBB3115422.1 hypothetical protein [Corynebacterium bovis DSM 20582 = CIP 54.80]QQC48300.1 hypothetical protein I6I09_05415 [Corynebacterium bovis]RRO82059.1 hypothetical protein CXF38_01935 [Corynebacterium bovis]RRO84094.1 hypothetical protein CXF36_01030 [Corynebacterium bovis]RRO84821.1 hypothetical protein CXF37_01940 [Corynebacterium bovis]